MSWDALLPALRLAPSTHTRSACIEAGCGQRLLGLECYEHKTRIIDVVYNASNNELVRTETLGKNCIVLTDSTLYRQWYESHYALSLGYKDGTKWTPEEEEIFN